MKKQSNDNQSRYTISSIDKALDVIEMLSEHGSLNLIELSKLLNKPKSSLYRIILTLEKRNYVTRSESNGKYCLGYQPLIITKNLLENNTLRFSAVTEMNNLVEKYGDTVNLGVLSKGEVIYVDIKEGTNSLRMMDNIGTRAPFHASAIGKVIVAYISENELDQLIIKRGLNKITPNTIIDPINLKIELIKIKERGFAIDDEEVVQGARCIAAPIFNMFGKVEGAISLSGAIPRFAPKKITEISSDVINATLNISRKLGYVNG